MVYLVWYINKNTFNEVRQLEGVFSTREKAVKYIDSIQELSNIEWFYKIEAMELY